MNADDNNIFSKVNVVTAPPEEHTFFIVNINGNITTYDNYNDACTKFYWSNSTNKQIHRVTTRQTLQSFDYIKDLTIACITNLRNKGTFFTESISAMNPPSTIKQDHDQINEDRITNKQFVIYVNGSVHSSYNNYNEACNAFDELKRNNTAQIYYVESHIRRFLVRNSTDVSSGCLIISRGQANTGSSRLGKRRTDDDNSRDVYRGHSSKYYIRDDMNQ